MTGIERRGYFAGLLPHRSSRTIDWRRSMSNHVAYALLIYTSLQIFVTTSALRAQGGSLMPYLALVVLVVAIIPACRSFEQRWERLSDDQAADPHFEGAFRRDRLVLWIMAIGLPFLLTGLFKGLGALLS